MSELDDLIREQGRDERYGDRVFSVSLDAPYGTSGDSLGDYLVEQDGTRKLLPPRSPHDTKRTRGLLGHRVRQERKAEASPAEHGTAAKYDAGCHCKPCRWANSRRAWDYREKRLGRSAAA